MRLGLPFRSESATASRAGPSRFRQGSLALRPLLRRLEGPTRASVLDLGAASGENLAFFSSLGARLTVADLYRSLLPAREELEPANDPRAVFDALLPHPPGAPFDVILAWDVLNYLKPEEIAWLTMSLQRRSKPGAITLAFVASSGEIPVRPAAYVVLDEETFLVDAPAPRRRPAPRYSEPMLLRLMTGASVESRFQLRNETVEYLFSHRLVDAVASV